MSDSDNQSLNPARKQENDEILAKAEEEANKALAEGNSGEPTESAAPSETPPSTPAEEAKPSEPNAEANTPAPAAPAPEAESETEPEKEEHSQLSERGQERVQDLANQANDVPGLQRKIKVLETIISRTGASNVPGWIDDKSKDPAKPAAPVLPWEQPTQTPPAENAEGVIEVSQEELNEQAREEGRKAAKEEIANEAFVNNLQTDAILAEEEFPQFRKSTKENPNPDFDPDLTNLVFGIFYNEYKNGNKEIRLKDVVSQVMSIRNKATEEGRKQSAAVIEKAAAEQAVDPSGTPAATQDENVESKIKGAKSMKELEALERTLPSSES